MSDNSLIQCPVCAEMWTEDKIKDLQNQLTLCNMRLQCAIDQRDKEMRAYVRLDGKNIEELKKILDAELNALTIEGKNE